MSNNLNKSELAAIYSARFENQDKERSVLWGTLCKYYFQKLISGNEVVLDLASGYCEFINNIKCGEKYAIDMNPEVKRRANKDVQVYIAPSDKLPASLTGKMDVVFVSNFFEHLDSKHQLLSTLSEIKRDRKSVV